MCIMASSTKIGIDVVEAQVRPIHSQHVDRKVMMAVEIVNLLIWGGHHPDVGSIQAACGGWKSSQFEKLVCEVLAVFRPPNDLILQFRKGLCDAPHHSTHCWSWWPSSIPHYMILWVCSKKMHKHQNLKQNINWFSNTVKCRNPNARNLNNAEIRTVSCSVYKRLDFGHSGCSVCSIVGFHFLCIEPNKNCSVLYHSWLSDRT